MHFACYFDLVNSIFKRTRYAQAVDQLDAVVMRCSRERPRDLIVMANMHTPCDSSASALPPMPFHVRCLARLVMAATAVGSQWKRGDARTQLGSSEKHNDVGS